MIRILIMSPVKAAWGNWTIDFLNNAFKVIKKAVKYCVKILTTSPMKYMAESGATESGTSAVWNAMEIINGALQGIATALLILFFTIGVMRTTATLAEFKRPEHAIKMLLRLALAKAAVTYSMLIVSKIVEIVQIIINKLGGLMNVEEIAKTYGKTNIHTTDQLIDSIFSVPQSVHDLFQGDVGTFNRIGLWLISLLGSIAMYVLAMMLVLVIMGRFFKIYLHAAFAPIPLSFFAGEPTANVGKSYIRSLATACMQGAIAILAFNIFFHMVAGANASVNPNGNAAEEIWGFVFRNIMNVLMLLGIIKISDQITKEIIQF